MNKLVDLLSKKVYGIPVGLLFAVLAAAALWGVLKYVPKSEPMAEDGGATNDDGTGGDPGFDQTGGVPVFIARPPTTDTGTNPVVPPAGVAEPTNEAWMRRGVEYLSTQNVRADFAQSALQKYLNGDDLTTSQAQYRDTAVKHLGLPPNLPSQVGGRISPRVGGDVRETTVSGVRNTLPAEVARLGVLRISRAVTKAGHTWAPVLNVGDISQGMYRAGIGFGSSLNVSDVEMFIDRMGA